ncbi:MAG: hypothetical protein HY820_14420 [Acidobacteria bacterium]|nr:hypothetical protein [Acidobacteriota bacterium]
MTFTLLNAIPILAGIFGAGFLFQMFRDARTQVRRSNKSVSDYFAELEEPEERWSTRQRTEDQTQPTRHGFETVESALTLSFAVVCLEALCFLIYLQITTPAETEGILGALRGNVLCYVGLTMVIVAGLARFKRIWK